jgi:hypothetical protein
LRAESGLSSDFGLWPESTVPVNAATTEKAMIYHALSQQKEGDCQRNEEQDPSNFEPP